MKKHILLGLFIVFFNSVFIIGMEAPWSENDELDCAPCSEDDKIKTVSIQDLIDNGQIPVIDGEGYLNLKNKNIKSLDGLSNIPCIEKVYTIDLSNNQLAQIGPKKFKGFNNLVRLFLSCNQLTQIDQSAFKGPKITGPNRLNFLYLDNNQLTQIDPNTFGFFNGLKNLIILNLSGNQLTQVYPRTFHALRRLIYLDLSYNQLTQFHHETFYEFNNSDNVYLNNNRLGNHKQYPWLTQTDLYNFYPQAPNSLREIAMNKLVDMCRGKHVNLIFLTQIKSLPKELIDKLITCAGNEIRGIIISKVIDMFRGKSVDSTLKQIKSLPKEFIDKLITCADKEMREIIMNKGVDMCRGKSVDSTLTQIIENLPEQLICNLIALAMNKVIVTYKDKSVDSTLKHIKSLGFPKQLDDMIVALIDKFTKTTYL